MKELGFKSYIIDPETNKLDPNFFDSEYLIINITSKSIDQFKVLIEYINQSKIKYVLFVSSTSVYKSSQDIIVESMEYERKEHPLALIEKMLQNNRRFKTTILRFAGLFGYDRNPGNFFKSGKRVKNPDSSVNLIHRDDCISIIHQIIIQGLWNETFNACMSSHPTKKKFYSFVTQLINNPIPSFDDETHEQKTISNEKLIKSLNYKFIRSDLFDFNLYI